MASNLDQTVPDILVDNLEVVFCGINPGLVSAKTRNHFARPGNRFWKALHLSGFTPRLLSPHEQALLPSFGIGVTNFIARPSATAKELTASEFRDGAVEIKQKIKKYSPLWLSVLGIEAYRKGFGVPFAKIGRQPQMIGRTKIWLLPNPSGLNAHYSLSDFTELFSDLRQTIIQQV